MARWQASVVIEYQVGEDEEGRSTEVQVEGEGELTLADIDAQVSSLVNDVFTGQGYENLQRANIARTYTWRLESVFELT